MELREQSKSAANDWEKERETMRLNSEQLSRELIQLKEQIRLERLMMVESKRR
jgi:hypothetical protein